MTDRVIKDCPFCGGKAKVMVCDSRGIHLREVGTESAAYGLQLSHCVIICTKCRIRTQPYLTRNGVYKAWNRRV